MGGRSAAVVVLGALHTYDDPLVAVDNLACSFRRPFASGFLGCERWT